MMFRQNLKIKFNFPGSGPRGNHGNDSAFDSYAGVYSYKPVTSYCVSESTGTAHALFQWHPNNQFAATPTTELLMLAMPHHVRKTTPILRYCVFVWILFCHIQFRLHSDCMYITRKKYDNVYYKIPRSYFLTTRLHCIGYKTSKQSSARCVFTLLKFS